jgi:hypothetical protein
VARDLLFHTESDTDWSIDPAGLGAKKLGLSFSDVERKTLKVLEPSTAAHAVNVVGWARSKGIPARLTATAIYTQEDSDLHYQEGRSSIKPGRLSWHQVGRAFHIYLPPLPSGAIDRESYARIGRYAREQGGEWLGDKPIKTVKGIIYDTAHFEYHPGWSISEYRKMPLAQREFEQAQKRARRFA